jgi:hypothetical protein
VSKFTPLNVIFFFSFYVKFIFLLENKKSSVKDNLYQGRIITIRGATLIILLRNITHGYIHSLTFLRLSAVTEYSAQNAFDCTLSGPFDNPLPTRLSALRALCVVATAFISASSV